MFRIAGIQSVKGTSGQTGMNMAQPSVTREPSMEEILASIRRIIESNEPDAGRPAGAGFAHKTFESDPVDPDPIIEDEEPIRLTVDLDLPSFAPERPQPSPRIEVSQPRIEVASMQQPLMQREAVRVAQPPVPQHQTFASAESMAALAEAAVREASVQPEIAPAASAQSSAPQPQMARPAFEAPRREEEPRSISLADVAARVRAASERVVSDPTRQPVRDVAPAPGGRSVELRAAPAERPAEPVVRAASSVQLPRASESLPVDDDIRAALDVRLDQIDDDMLPVDNLVSESDEDIDTSKALVSASTGDQVARSFHELAEMVNSNSKRSMDEVAEDLLRPMLQEWLDDNLPTLVERLVREEIERVARGPRR